MKREVERTKKLPSFSIRIGDLEVLWNKLSDLFDTDDIYGSINIKLTYEKFTFKNIEELKECNDLPDKVLSFSLYLSGEEKKVMVTSPDDGLYSECYVHAYAETEAWCAGAVETVYSFISSYKRWYSWFNSAPIGWLLIIFACASLVVIRLSKTDPFNEIVEIGGLTAFTTIYFLYMFKGKLFPVSILHICNNENYIRRHIPELSLILAIISILVTIGGWYLEI